MKEFDKCWLESVCRTPINCGGLPCRDCRIVREEGWREALEFSLRCLQEQYEGGLSAFDVITEELNS